MNQSTGETLVPGVADAARPVVRPSIVAAILTDLQFWIPVAVLAIGLGLLAFLS